MVRGHLKQLCSYLVIKHEPTVIRLMDEMNGIKGILRFGYIIRKRGFYIWKIMIKKIISNNQTWTPDGHSVSDTNPTDNGINPT